MNRTVVVTSIFSQQQSAVAEAFHQKGWVVRGTSRQASPHPFARIFGTGRCPGCVDFASFTSRVFRGFSRKPDCCQ